MRYDTWSFERVAGPYGFTEGPVWDGAGLLFSDIDEDEIRRYDPATGECGVVRSDTRGANGLKFGPDGRLYACESTGRRVSRYERDGSATTVAGSYGGVPLNSPNDLAFDDDGRLWFTDPRYGDDSDLDLDHQSVYRADPSGDGWDLERVTRDTTKPNGILVSPDDETLLVAQSDYDEDAPTELRAYPIADDGTLGGYDVLHNFHPHRGVDGMCLTAGGEVVACAGWAESGPGPMLYVFAPSGRVLETHPFPGSQPTNCAFGGADLSALYVCGGDGFLYRAETERTGLLGAPDGPVVPWG